MELFPQSSSQSIEHLDNDSFVQLHLSKPSDAFLTSISVSRPLLAAIDDVRGRSKKVAYLLQYFAVLSHGAYTDIQEKPSTRPEPLYFVQHSRSRISCHPCDTQASFSPTAVGISIHPDDIRAYERSGRCVPWHAVDTVVQIVDNLDAPNTANLVECLLKARPDLTGAYFLLLDKTVGCMRVGWYDASGVHYSQQYSIGQSPEILESFVYSFYYPLPDHPLYDSTLHMETPGIMEPTTWRITAGEHTYSKAKLIFSGEVIGRRTNVFKCEEGGQVTIIKDAYLPQTQLASESNFLQAVHSEGIVDAVVPLKNNITVQSAAGRPYTTIAAEDAVKHHRVLVKARLVLGASGVRLDNAKSVKDLCMAIFDANEALRELSRQGIFHRDMSPGNVLMYPSHDTQWAVRQRPSSTAQDVRYVKNVMANQPRDDTSSTALIIDFDRAAVANPNNPMTATLQYSKEILARRTGTPGYRARSVATTSVARRFRFCPMPKLGEQARELYINAYGQASYDTWEDKPQQVHGVPLVAKDDTTSKVAFEYREEHDVEALFWVFIRTLLLATPKKTHPADTQEVLRSKAFRLGQCLEHFQQSNNAKDFRDELLRKTAEEWKTVLPTRLQSTIPLIVQLGRQVYPEYALLKEQPAPGHLHEAFRRILLNFIVKIKDPIPLLPGVRRSVHLEPTTVAATEIMLPQDVASGAIIPIANLAATRVAHTKSENTRNPALPQNGVYAENSPSTSLAEGRVIKPLRKTRPIQDIRAETSAIPGLPTPATSTRKRTREPGYADYTEDIQGLMKACGLDSDTEGEESASSSPGKKRRCM